MILRECDAAYARFVREATITTRLEHPAIVPVHDLDASVFGSLLPPDTWGRVPEDRLAALVASAPCFRPEVVPESTNRSASARSRSSS